MKIKRYQIWAINGLGWSYWFPCNGAVEEKWQLKNKLLNEYKEVGEEEWAEINKKQKEDKKNKHK